VGVSASPLFKGGIMKKFIPLLLLALCGCDTLPLDTSMEAFAAGDSTLAVSACDGAPGYGFDICRVSEGTMIQSAWKLIVPTDTKYIESWEVDVYYRDVAQSVKYTGKGSVITINWADFFKSKTWDKSMNGEAMALVTVRYKDPTGVVKSVFFKGLAKIVVLSAGYSRLPIGSGVQAWSTACTVEYSTAGRGAVQCQP
jgi:hypothetical protein